MIAIQEDINLSCQFFPISEMIILTTSKEFITVHFRKDLLIVQSKFTKLISFCLKLMAQTRLFMSIIRINHDEIGPEEIESIKQMNAKQMTLEQSAQDQLKMISALFPNCSDNFWFESIVLLSNDGWFTECQIFIEDDVIHFVSDNNDMISKCKVSWINKIYLFENINLIVVSCNLSCNKVKYVILSKHSNNLADKLLSLNKNKIPTYKGCVDNALSHSEILLQI